jgi:hypothetical protein
LLKSGYLRLADGVRAKQFRSFDRYTISLLTFFDKKKKKDKVQQLKTNTSVLSIWRARLCRPVWRASSAGCRAGTSRLLLRARRRRPQHVFEQLYQRRAVEKRQLGARSVVEHGRRRRGRVGSGRAEAAVVALREASVRCATHTHTPTRARRHIYTRKDLPAAARRGARDRSRSTHTAPDSASAAARSAHSSQSPVSARLPKLRGWRCAGPKAAGPARSGRGRRAWRRATRAPARGRRRYWPSPCSGTCVQGLPLPANCCA